MCFGSCLSLAITQTTAWLTPGQQTNDPVTSFMLAHSPVDFRRKCRAREPVQYVVRYTPRHTVSRRIRSTRGLHKSRVITGDKMLTRCHEKVDRRNPCVSEARIPRLIRILVVDLSAWRRIGRRTRELFRVLAMTQSTGRQGGKEKWRVCGSLWR